MQACSEQAHTDSGGQHGSDGLKITNPFSAKKAGSLWREAQVVRTPGTNDIFKMVALVLFFCLPIPLVPIHADVMVQHLLYFHLLPIE